MIEQVELQQAAGSSKTQEQTSLRGPGALTRTTGRDSEGLGQGAANVRRVQSAMILRQETFDEMSKGRIALILFRYVCVSKRGVLDCTCLSNACSRWVRW